LSDAQERNATVLLVLSFLFPETLVQVRATNAVHQCVKETTYALRVVRNNFRQSIAIVLHIVTEREISVSMSSEYA